MGCIPGMREGEFEASEGEWGRGGGGEGGIYSGESVGRLGGA
jgi:hypothetical protein